MEFLKILLWDAPLRLIGFIAKILVRILEELAPALMATTICLVFMLVMNVKTYERIKEISDTVSQNEEKIGKAQIRLSDLSLIIVDEKSNEVDIVKKLAQVEKNIIETKAANEKISSLLVSKPENIKSITEIQSKLNSLNERIDRELGDVEDRVENNTNRVFDSMNSSNNTLIAIIIIIITLGLSILGYFFRADKNKKN